MKMQKSLLFPPEPEKLQPEVLKEGQKAQPKVVLSAAKYIAVLRGYPAEQQEKQKKQKAKQDKQKQKQKAKQAKKLQKEKQEKKLKQEKKI